jgi:hypothetical protein
MKRAEKEMRCINHEFNPESLNFITTADENFYLKDLRDFQINEYLKYLMCKIFVFCKNFRHMLLNSFHCRFEQTKEKVIYLVNITDISYEMKYI